MIKLLSLKNIPMPYFLERLSQKYAHLTLVQEFITIDSHECVAIHCSECNLTSYLSYKTLFSKDTVKGCRYCRHNKKHRVFGFTESLFLQEAAKKWGNRFTYSNLDIKRNVRAEDQVINVFCVECNNHFTTNIRYHLYLNSNGGGCSVCSARLNKISVTGTTDNFIALAKEKWGDSYGYSDVVYTNIDTEVKIYCKEHLEFFSLTPYKHLNNKYGCPICGNKKKNDRINLKMLTKFQAEVNRRIEIGDLNLDSAVYSGFLSPVALQCNRCGCKFSTIGQHFINEGGRCPICHPPRSFSKVSQDAIAHIENALSIKFVSSLNGYEHVIYRDKNIFKVDAYNADLNLIIEFYGDLFHGNPNLYSPDHTCHPYYKNVTAYELYTKTKERENYLLAAGYNLITIWDSDWQTNPCAVVHKVGLDIKRLKEINQCV
jgi:hypothetical protein